MLERRVPKAANVDCELHLLQGHPADEIVRLASGHMVDLIVVGTHGRTGLTRVLVGSVAESIMRHAKCPVLVVKADETLSESVQIESLSENSALVKPE
jgi:nucleotide-binding universal stress UspA family protein